MRDGNPDTAWITPFDAPVGSEIFLTLSPSTPSRELRLHVRTDKFHSTPRSITVTDSRNDEYAFNLTESAGMYSVELPPEFVFPLTSLRIDDIEQKTFRNYFTRDSRILPVAITEIEIGATNSRKDANVSSECRDDLLFINDTAVPLRIVSPDNPFDTSQHFDIEACTDVQFIQGDNYIRTANGLDIGFDINQLVLQSPTSTYPSEPYSTVSVQSRSSTKITANVTASTSQIVSFGQSINRGWKATLRTQDSTIDLGEPFVVQGYANGWLVPESGVLTLEWTPQRVVSLSLIISLLSALILAVFAWRRPRTQPILDNYENLAPRANTSPSLLATLLVCGLLLVVAGVWATIISVVLLRVAQRWSALLVGLLMCVLATIVVVQQTRYGYPPTLDWPLRFAELTPLAWTAVAIASINALLRRQ